MIDDARNNPNGLQFWEESWEAVYADPRVFTTQVFGIGETNNTVNYGQNRSTDAPEQQAVQKKLMIADANTDRNVAYQQRELPYGKAHYQTS